MYTVLVVDDDPLIRAIVKDTLDTRHYKVLTAKDVSEGLHILKKEKIDAILLDVVMPGESGFEMVPKIAKVSPDSAVIIMTAFATADAAIEAIQVGVDDFIRKPLQKSELLQAIIKGVYKKKLVIQNRELTRQLAARLEKLELFKKVSSEISITLNLRELLEEVMQSVKESFEAQACSVLLFDKETGELAFEVVLGDKSEQVKSIRIKPGQGIAGWVFEHNEALLVADVTKDKRFFQAIDKKTGFESRSMIAAPLIARNITLGVIQVINSVDEAIFEVEDRDSLITLSGQIAIAIDNARMTEHLKNSKEALQRAHDGLEMRVLERTGELAATNAKLKREVEERKSAEKETRRHLDQFDAMRSIDKAIVGSLDLSITLDIIITQTISRLKIDAADILLYKPHFDTLEYAAGHGFNTRALQYTKLKVGSSYAGQAALERRIIRIADLREGGERFQQSKHLSEEGFISYYGVPLIAKGVLKGVLEIFSRNPIDESEEWVNFLEALAGQAAIAVDNAALFNDLQRSNADLIQAYDTTIEGWAKALDLRDKETEGHSRRVTELTLQVASLLEVSEEKQGHMRRGALLHDIGKMGIPDSILLKPGKLDEEEWVIMQRHARFAYELLSPIEYLRPALDIPYCHHEKWDGTGYPQRLKGEQIPLAARIFAVVDIYDAMTSDRPYSPARKREEVLEHIRSLVGSHLDPKVVEAFLEISL